MTVNPLRPEDSEGAKRLVSGSPIDHFVQACLDEAHAKGIDPSELDFAGPAVHELSAAERIAEHTGHREWLLVDEINEFLTERGKPLTSGEQAYIAAIVQRRS